MLSYAPQSQPKNIDFATTVCRNGPYPQRPTNFVALRARKPMISLQQSPRIMFWTFLAAPWAFETVGFATTHTHLYAKNDLWTQCKGSPMFQRHPKILLQTLISLQLFARITFWISWNHSWSFETSDFAAIVSQDELWAPCKCFPILPEAPGKLT